MKKRLHDKKAGIAILISLIIISLAEVIFRAAGMGLEAVLSTSNFGEQFAVIALAVIILVLTAKGKDRACYILYGAWLGCFVFDQLFGLPGMIVNMLVRFANPGILQVIIRVIGMICIVAIGALLVKYMNDGTIYNKAFNAMSVITILLLVASVIWGIVVMRNSTNMIIYIINSLSRIAMVFMTTFFAYDSAKAQLKKTNLSK